MSEKASGGPKSPGASFELADHLHSAAIRLLRWLRREDGALGMSAARLSVLSVLVFGGPRRLGELAAVEQVRPPTMSRLVAGLEKQGWVRREPGRQDRRVVRVVATPQGEEILHRGRRRRVRALARELEALGAEECKILAAAAGILTRLAESASATS